MAKYKQCRSDAVLADDLAGHKVIEVAIVTRELANLLEPIVRDNMEKIYNEIKWDGCGYDRKAKKCELLSESPVILLLSSSSDILGFVKIDLDFFVEIDNVVQPCYWIVECQCVIKGMGHGTLLMDQLIKKYGTQVIGLTVQINNLQVVKFYEKYNFKEFEKFNDCITMLRR